VRLFHQQLNVKTNGSGFAQRQADFQQLSQDAADRTPTQSVWAGPRSGRVRISVYIAAAIGCKFNWLT
jgi:hypothetical protein